MAVELRNRLAGATGLEQPATSLFDYPTPRALAHRLQGDLVGQLPQRVVASPSLVPGVQCEPIAIVAMSCRYPGGAIRRKRGFAAERCAISSSRPRGGRDIEALYDPDPDARRGRHTRVRADFCIGRRSSTRVFGISARGAGDRPAAAAAGDVGRLWSVGLRRRRCRVPHRGTCGGDACNDHGMRCARACGSRAIRHRQHAERCVGPHAYTLGLQGPAISIDTALVVAGCGASGVPGASRVGCTWRWPAG
jgi:hypothetical protein